MIEHNDTNIGKLVTHLIQEMSLKELVEVVSVCDLKGHAFKLLHYQYTEDEEAFYEEYEKAEIK